MSSARQQAAVLAELLRHERDALAEFLSALADFDRRRAWADLGHDSLFAFLVKDLGLSNGAAAYRRAAVELVQRFPQVLEHLRTGELCITTVFELSKVVTDENASEVIPRFFGASKRDAQDVVAELAPEPAPQRTVVTLVQAPAVAPADRSTSSGRLADHAHANFDLPAQEGRASGAVAPASSRTVVEPKTAELSRVHVTVSRQLLEKLAAAKDALSHSHPNASDADVIEVGLELVIRRHWKRRGIGAKPRKPAPKAAAPAAPPTKRSRHVPAAVWRAVWERDQGCCAWPLEGGGVCGSTDRVEFDHVDGFALGGETSVERGRLLCRPHQLEHARRLYGDRVMDRYARNPGARRCSEPVAPYAATPPFGAFASPTPSFFRTIAAGQKPVKALWSRFAPTKAVNQSQRGSWCSGLPGAPRATEISTKVPARTRIARSMVMRGSCGPGARGWGPAARARLPE